VEDTTEAAVETVSASEEEKEQTKEKSEERLSKPAPVKVILVPPEVGPEVGKMEEVEATGVNVNGMEVDADADDEAPSTVLVVTDRTAEDGPAGEAGDAHFADEEDSTTASTRVLSNTQ
jgi:hypothetical protein